jgi:two-component system, sensor histidine kinase YesM
MIKSVAKRFYTHLNNISIRSKILLFSIAISIVPMLIVTYLNYYGIAEKMKSSITFSANQVFLQNKQLLEDKVNTVWNISVSVASDKDVIQYSLSRHPDDYYSDYMAQTADYLKLQTYVTGYQKYPEVLRAIIYSSSRNMFANENTNFFNMENAAETDWYKSLIGKKDLLVWYPSSSGIVTQSGSPVVTALRKIRNLDNYNQLLGILRIDMPMSQISAIMGTDVVTPNTFSFILNSSGRPVYANRDVGLLAGGDLGYETLSEKYKDSSRWYAVPAARGGYLLKCAPVKHTDWVMVMMIPNSDLLATSYKTRDDMILVALITSVIVSALAYLISYSLTRRIRTLANRMHSIDGIEVEAVLAVDGQDELGQLQKSYNAMLNRIHTLIKEEHRLGQEVKSSELKALQAQINPHFLYNTLDLIHWRAMNRGVPEINDVVQALARYYKLGLSGGLDMVSLSSEIEHAQIYIKIQNERFSNLISLEVDVQSETLNCKVLKLLLQPLVENSILHGIMEKRAMKGMIKISSCLDDGMLKITVDDDGVGMSNEQIAGLLDTSSKSEHYGIKNINERMKLLYGQEYGLQYQSKIGKGTIVVITSPVIF